MRTPSFLLASLLTLAATSALPAQSKSETAPLPPALNAAILSGNSKAVTQVISTLSGGNPSIAASLASQVINAAERMVATNPGAALQAASAAVNVVKMTTVNTASPTQTASVLNAAARIFVNPGVQRTNPTAATELALNTVNTAATIDNADLASSIAAQAVGTAQAVAASDPASAALLASASIKVAQSTAVSANQPTQAAEIALVASRVIALPSVQKSSPVLSAEIAQSIVQVVTNPAVYQSSPQGAMQSMANAYATVTSASVSAAVPSAAQTMGQSLRSAQSNTQLAEISKDNGAQLATILDNPQNPVPQQVINTNSQTTSINQFDNTLIVSPSS
jgi:hypothetical protein